MADQGCQHANKTSCLGSHHVTVEILLAKWKKTKSVEEEMLFPSFIRGITNIKNKQTGEYKILVLFPIYCLQE